MNNLAYTSQEPEKVIPKIQEILKKDLGVSSDIPYKVEDENTSKTSIGTFLKDGAKVFFGGKEALLFSLIFEVNQPRPVKIQMHVNRQGIGSHVGTIIFTANLTKAVKAEVSLQEPKTFGTSKFEGDADSAGKLNSSKDLLKKCDKFAHTKSDVGGGITADRFFKIIPAESGSMLVVRSLPRATSMGMSATTDAKDFFEITDLIEKSL
jgi:hypothetical protein